MANGEKWTEGLVFVGPFGRNLWAGISLEADGFWHEASPGSARLIGSVSQYGMGDAEAFANGFLWAAAPDLFTACTPLALSDPESPPPGVAVEDWRRAVLAARAARAKARGEA